MFSIIRGIALPARQRSVACASCFVIAPNQLPANQAPTQLAHQSSQARTIYTHTTTPITTAGASLQFDELPWKPASNHTNNNTNNHTQTNPTTRSHLHTPQIQTNMKAIQIKDAANPGEENTLVWGDAPKPTPKQGEVLVRVLASACNRADLMQRRGAYPPPPGASDILGLECCGIVEELGEGVTSLAVGDRVASILTGGGYAQYATLPAATAIRVPESMSDSEGAALSEAWLTAFQCLHWHAEIAKLGAKHVLIHAGASGVGAAATQLCTQIDGLEIICTAGSQAKLDFCKSQGAHHAINYKESDFEEEVLKITNKRGVDVVLCFVGASYWQKNLKCMAADGRLVLIGLLGGREATSTPLGTILVKRLRIQGTTLRARDVDYKQRLTNEFVEYAIPRFADKRFRVVIDKEFPLSDAQSAHAYVQQNKNMGKVVLKVE